MAKTKSLSTNFMMLFLLLSGIAFSATGGGTATGFFTPAWNTINAIMGDNDLGYIVAVFMLINAMRLLFAPQIDWGKILIYVIGAGFTASITALAVNLSGAIF